MLRKQAGAAPPEEGAPPPTQPQPAAPSRLAGSTGILSEALEQIKELAQATRACLRGTPMIECEKAKLLGN